MRIKSINTSYKFYKKISQEPVILYHYLEIAREYNKFLIDKVISGQCVSLPERMGSLHIQGKIENVRFDQENKIKGLAPDWVKTKKLWDSNEKAKTEKKLLYHINKDNTRYKFFWSKHKIVVKNKILYSLLMTRANKRAAHKAIINGTQYITKT